MSKTLRRTSVFLLVLAMMMVLFMAGCNPKEPAADNADGTAADTSEGTSEGASEGTSEGTSEDQPAEQEPITLKVAHTWGGSDPKAPVLENVWQRFQEENPNITLEIEEIPSLSFNDKFTTWLSADDLPDVISVEGLHIEQLVGPQKMLDLTSYYEADPDWYDTFVPGIFEMGATYDGKIYAMPNEYFSLPLFVNVDILNELGVSMPQTWDELMAAMKAVNDDGTYLPLSIWGVLADNSGVWFLSALGANGGSQKWIDACNGEGSFSDPLIIDALNRMLEVCSYAQEGINGTEWTTSMANFNTRQSVFYLNGPWAIQQLAQGDEGEAFLDSIELISIPYVVPEMEGYCLTNVVSYWTLNSELSGAKADAAVKLLKEITSAQTTKEIMETAQCLNGITGVDVDEEKIGMLADIFVLMDNLPEQGAAYPNPWPNFTDPEITSEFQISLQKVVDGTMTPEEFAVKMDELVGN